MYNDFFGFREAPFSIAPDPRYLYLSERHKEALAHLMYGVQGQGGFIVITGEVGTGKTTVCRCFLDTVPKHVDIALVLNPKLSARELLASICDELRLRYPAGSSIKRLIDLINSHLLNSHAQGRHTVLVIDEAQNLSIDVLEQLRLLTNLETGEKKLLQIVLLGQPELQEILARQELRQLAQRITARYHLNALGRDELPAYLRYRLSVAGGRHVLFLPGAVKALYRLSGGVPRLVNLIADRGLLGAYAQGATQVDARTLRQAGREIQGDYKGNHKGSRRTQGVFRPFHWVLASALVCVIVAAALISGDLNGWGLNGWHLAPGITSTSADASPDGAQTPTEDSPAETPVDIPVAETSESIGEEAAREALALPERDQDSRDSAIPDAEPVAEESSTASDLLSNWVPDPAHTGDAYKALFQSWGLSFDPMRSGYACEFAEQQGLRCLHRQGNWRSLEQLNRPAVLRLFNRAGESYHVALLEMDGDRAHIVMGGLDHHLDRAAINDHWLGDYSIIWRLPPYESSLSKGEVDRDQWLQEALANLRDAHDVDPAYSAELTAAPLNLQVEWFQRLVGLVPDGIPGAVTLIRMNTALDPTVPRLIVPAVPKHLARQD